eukprot:363962-Chlamydomonas_euryale.AAC.4
MHDEALPAAPHAACVMPPHVPMPHIRMAPCHPTFLCHTSAHSCAVRGVTPRSTPPLMYCATVCHDFSETNDSRPEQHSGSQDGSMQGHRMSSMCRQRATKCVKRATECVKRATECG